LLTIYQQPVQFFPVCLYQTSFYWNYTSLRSWLYHQSYESSSHLSHSSWLICCIWHYIDHYILLELLASCISISSALSWIKSYLINRSFYVNIENSKSSVFQPLYEAPQGSVLGPILFILYTIPLSTVISNLAANHHLYADDNKLLLSFSALDFSHNITHFENIKTNVSNWMSSNSVSLILLKLSFSSLVYFSNSLNSIILPFIYLTMSYSHMLILLAILVSSLIKICHLHNISDVSKSCFHNIRDLRHIRNTTDQTTASTIATSLIHSIIDYCNSLLLNLPATQTIVFNLSWTLLFVLSPKLLNFITLLLF